jgi:hypothetical protein
MLPRPKNDVAGLAVLCRHFLEGDFPSPCRSAKLARTFVLIPQAGLLINGVDRAGTVGADFLRRVRSTIFAAGWGVFCSFPVFSFSENVPAIFVVDRVYFVCAKTIRLFVPRLRFVGLMGQQIALLVMSSSSSSWVFSYFS